MSPVTLPFLISLAAKGAILLIATALAAGLARRARASVRHAVWAAGLTGLLLVPVLSMGLPRWEVVTLPSLGNASSAVSESSPIAPLATESLARVAPPPALPTETAASTAAIRSEAGLAGRAPARFDAGRAIIGVWMAGAGLLLVWVLFGHLRVRTIIRSASARLSPEWQQTIDGVLARSPLEFGVRFRETPDAMPMAAGILRPVVLLPRAGAGWSEAHRRDVVIHELAHVRRRDCLTHLATRIACAVHWFNPLAWIAARQARVEREHACDDAVLAAGAVPSSYAQELLDTARTSPAAWATASAGLTMARPSHLSTRLLAVLDAGRRRGRLGPAALASASFGTLALMAPVAALAPAHARPVVVAPSAGTARPAAETQAPAATPPRASLGQSGQSGQPEFEARVPAVGVESEVACPYVKGGKHRTVRLTSSMSITGRGSADDGKGNSFVVWTGADCSVVFRVVGEPAFTADESEVAEFKTSGRFSVTEEVGSTERIYDVRGDRGSLTRRYAVGGEERSIDAEAKRWIAGMILEYIRQSGYQAEQRARRILAASGVPGLLEEITAIGSDHGRSRYYLAGIGARQNPEDIAGFLDHASTRLESDYEKGRILSAVPPRMLGEPRVRTSFLAVTRTIDSDYEKARALVAASGGGLDQASTRTALTAATTVGSAYERSRVLQAVTATAPAGQDLDPLYFEAVTGVDSDYEKARVLMAYARHGGLSDASLGRLYAAAATITSSNELAGVLVASLTSATAASARCSGYLAATSRIDSDFEKARALVALQAMSGLNPTCTTGAATEAGSIESSSERARVLIDFVGHGLLTDATRVAFFRSARGTDSSYDLRRVLTAVLSRGKLGTGVLTDVLDTAAGIESDNDLASVLVAAAGTGQIGETVRPAYLRAAARMSSDYERRRALTAIGAPGGD